MTEDKFDEARYNTDPEYREEWKKIWNEELKKNRELKVHPKLVEHTKDGWREKQ